MIYILYTQDWEDFEIEGLFDGPVSMDVFALREEFYANFDQRTLGHRIQMLLQITQDHHILDTHVSGSIHVAGTQSLATNADLERHQKWNDEREKIHASWHEEKELKIEEWKKKYPGENVSEMFVSYLKIEHGFKEIEGWELVRLRGE